MGVEVFVFLVDLRVDLWYNWTLEILLFLIGGLFLFFLEIVCNIFRLVATTYTAYSSACEYCCWIG